MQVDKRRSRSAGLRWALGIIVAGERGGGPTGKASTCVGRMASVYGLLAARSADLAERTRPFLVYNGGFLRVSDEDFTRHFPVLQSGFEDCKRCHDGGH